MYIYIYIYIYIYTYSYIRINTYSYIGLCWLLVSGHHEVAFYGLVAAALSDGLDGLIARSSCVCSRREMEGLVRGGEGGGCVCCVWVCVYMCLYVSLFVLVCVCVCVCSLCVRVSECLCVCGCSCSSIGLSDLIARSLCVSEKGEGGRGCDFVCVMCVCVCLCV